VDNKLHIEMDRKVDSESDRKLDSLKGNNREVMTKE
jgi:hypothetical protein